MLFRLYVYLIWSRIRSQMQYRASFLLELLGFMLLTGFEFVTTVILVQRFDSVGGWSLAEIALLYALTSISFSFAEMIGRGFDYPFERMMQQGTFDTLLLRPLTTFFQVLTSEFQLRRLGRTFQALIVFVFAISQLAIVWTPDKIILLPLTMVGGACIYIGLTVIGATVTFWTIRTPEIINVFTAGGSVLTAYPLSIYDEVIRFIFLAIIPVAFASYPTALWILERTDPNGLPAWLAWFALPIGILFLTVARRIWSFGVQFYQGTGS